jgi:hypothetical protein
MQEAVLPLCLGKRPCRDSGTSLFHFSRIYGLSAWKVSMGELRPKIFQYVDYSPLSIWLSYSGKLAVHTPVYVHILALSSPEFIEFQLQQTWHSTLGVY